MTLVVMLLTTVTAWAADLTGFLTVSSSGTATGYFAYSNHFYRVDWSGINTSETSSVKLRFSATTGYLYAQRNGQDSDISLVANASSSSSWMTSAITGLTPGQSSDGYTQYECLATGASYSAKKVCTVTCMAATVTWNWSSDHTTCTATFTCTAQTSLTATVNATVTTSGDTSTARATFNGISYSDTKTWAWTGTGTSADPFQIANKTDLETLRNNVNGGTDYENTYFVQTADITLSGAWTPIGKDADHPFKGRYNGGGFAISGLTVTITNGQYAGLFGYVVGGTYQGSEASTHLGEVHGVVLQNPAINVTANSSNQYAGAVVGYAGSCAQVYDNTVIGGSVTYTGGSNYNTNNSYAGGVVGYYEDSHLPKLSGNKVSGTTVSGGGICGGIVGYFRGGTGFVFSGNFADADVSSAEFDLNTGIHTYGYRQGALAGGYNIISGGTNSVNYYHSRNGLTAYGNKTEYQAISPDPDNSWVSPLYTVNAPIGLTVCGTATVSLNGTDYYAQGASVTLGHGDRTGYVFKGYESSAVTITNGTFTMPASDVTVSAQWYDLALFGYNDDPLVDGSADHPYVISSADGWNLLCDALQDNDTWNRFSGKTVKLGADITVTRMAGSSHHDFCGTFDGDGHTLYVSYGTNSEPIAEDNVAPFRNVENGCVIKNLHVTGHIYTSAKNAAGIAGTQYGTVSIENCRSSVTIHSYTSGDGTHGGILGRNGDNLTIEGCVFDGKLLTTNGTIRCGGFIGWCNSTTNITNSLYAPAALEEGETEVGTSESATFGRKNAATVTIINSYYTRALGTAQGKAPRTVTAGDNATVSDIAISGTETQYTVSGITAYADGGIQRGTDLYYGQGDRVTLTLSNTLTGAPTGYCYDGFTVSPAEATLTGNVLTMPDADVTVSGIVSATLRSTGQPVTVSYVLADGTTQEAQAIALDGTETSLASGNYFAGLPEVNFDHTLTLTGDATLILADGCQMNIGTSESRINDFGIGGNTKNLTITSQSTGDDMGTLGIYVTGDSKVGIYTNNITINGGHVIANTNGILTKTLGTNNNVTINGGTVEATATGWRSYAISAFGNFNYNGGNVTATATGSNGHAIYANGKFIYNGGNLIATATGSNSYAIYANGKHYTFNWRTPADRITIGSTGLYASTDSYTATFSKPFTDGTKVYSTSLTGNELNALAGKTLYPYVENIELTANAHDGNYWTTFYCSHTGYQIDDAENACAYTATVANSTITLHKLGKVIPAGTAVIVVGADSEISMTASTDAAEYSVGNSLQGVDVRTEKSTLGDGTFYVLGKKDSHFGFHKYEGQTMPARKAYLMLSGSGAHALTMAFDGETTALTLVNSEKRIVNSEVYDLQGRRLDGKPTAKGLYIVNGKKVIIK